MRAFRAGLLWTNSHTRLQQSRLVWTAVILNSSETSWSLSNGRILKICSLAVYIKSFGGQKGGSLELPQTPPPCLRGCILSWNTATCKTLPNASRISTGMLFPSRWMWRIVLLCLSEDSKARLPNMPMLFQRRSVTHREKKNTHQNNVKQTYH